MFFKKNQENRHSKKKTRKKEALLFISEVWRDVKSFLTWGDWLAFGFVCVSCFALFVFIVIGTNTNAQQVEIIASNEQFIYSLDVNQTINFTGPVGKTQVSIINGQVDVISSPGRQQICVNAVPISKTGQWLACLPNKVFIRIIGNGIKNADGFDGLSF